MSEWDPFPFKGTVIWLTEEQGGSPKGIPPEVPEGSYRPIGSVGALSPNHPCAGMTLRGWDPTQWHSEAEARWLLEGVDLPVVPGDVITISVGGRPRAFFWVHRVDP